MTLPRDVRLLAPKADDEPLVRLANDPEERSSPARPAGLFPSARINSVPSTDKSLKSDDIHRIQELEKQILDEVRPQRGVHFSDFEEIVGSILIGEVRYCPQGGRVVKSYRAEVPEVEIDLTNPESLTAPGDQEGESPQPSFIVPMRCRKGAWAATTNLIVKGTFKQ